MSCHKRLSSYVYGPFAVLAMACSLTAQAHVTYTGRDLGSFTGLSGASASIDNQVIAGNYSWADATDADFADSHKAKIFRFHLDNEALVTITAQANPTASSTAVGGWLPGFSIYSGLAHVSPFPADYEAAAITRAFLNETFPDGKGGTTKEGAWNALGDWRIGNDVGKTFADLTTLVFKGYAVDGSSANFGATPGIVGDGVADGRVGATFRLVAGDYSLFVGGADYAAQLPSHPDVSAPYGMSVSVNVAAIPEPSTVVLTLMGIAVVASGVRRRASA